MEWETVIGLEIHTQLATRSKLFSGSSTAFGAAANTQASAGDLGMPGTLPVVNREAVRMAVQFGLAVNANISPQSRFARKQYFYPDLPPGYQISQHEPAVVQHGYMDIRLDDGSSKRIGITRAHLEADAGKSLHEDFHGMSGIDLNRAGTALLEIVSEPDMRSAAEAVAYMKRIHELVRYIGICDGNMQEGSFRCDANVSVRPKGQEEFGTRVELKNINSFRFVEKAIEYEVERQIAVLEGGGSLVQETRLYDPDRNETRSMRSKEDATDYRYFPDPDLLPLVIGEDFVNEVRGTLPELPQQRRLRFVTEYQLSDYDADQLTGSRQLADYYEAVIEAVGGEAKLCANWVMGELSASLNRDDIGIGESPVSSTQLAGMLKRMLDHTISGKIAKEVFEAMWQGEGDADSVIDKRGLRQITDVDAIEKILDGILAANPDNVAAYRAGKDKLFGFFVGQAMKQTRGKANPQQINELLKKKLSG